MILVVASASALPVCRYTYWARMCSRRAAHLALDIVRELERAALVKYTPSLEPQPADRHPQIRGRSVKRSASSATTRRNINIGDAGPAGRVAIECIQKRRVDDAEIHVPPAASPHLLTGGKYADHCSTCPGSRCLAELMDAVRSTRVLLLSADRGRTIFPMASSGDNSGLRPPWLRRRLRRGFVARRLAIGFGLRVLLVGVLLVPRFILGFFGLPARGLPTRSSSPSMTTMASAFSVARMPSAARPNRLDRPSADT